MPSGAGTNFSSGAAFVAALRRHRRSRRELGRYSRSIFTVASFSAWSAEGRYQPCHRRRCTKLRHLRTLLEFALLWKLNPLSADHSFQSVESRRTLIRSGLNRAAIHTKLGSFATRCRNESSPFCWRVFLFCSPRPFRSDGELPLSGRARPFAPWPKILFFWCRDREREEISVVHARWESLCVCRSSSNSAISAWEKGEQAAHGHICGRP